MMAIPVVVVETVTVVVLATTAAEAVVATEITMVAPMVALIAKAPVKDKLVTALVLEPTVRTMVAMMVAGKPNIQGK
jgi:hypothetical protein